VRGNQRPCFFIIWFRLGGVLYFNPEKFANANTFKANLSQKLFSNTLGSNTSLGLKTPLKTGNL
jgi:hypothetical protein